MLFLTLLGSLLVVALSTDLPTQVHIALAGIDSNRESNSMAVSWNTKEQTGSSIVKYGTSSGVYTASSSGRSAAYYETFNHHVVLSTLEPNTRYYYIVGDDNAGWSSEFSFVSTNTASQLRGNYSFFVFGDLGVVNGDATAKYITDHVNDVKLVWHSGDVSYADDSFLHIKCAVKFCYEDTFDTYMKTAEGWASSVPYMTAPGNHEADCHDPACLASKERREKLSNFTAYNGRFRMPSEETGGVLNMWYSFNYGNAHFISLDTETGYPGAAEETRYVLPCGGFGDQLTWLENDLIAANKDRNVRPWIFATGHHPMYNGDSQNAEFQKAMENLFYKYGVDVYFAGHVHSYERDYPVYAGAVEMKTYDNPLATTHLLIGGAGNDEMKDATRDAMKDPSPREGKGLSKWWSSDADGAWTAVTDKEKFGIGKVTITDDNVLQFEYIRTSTGEVFDSITLTRDHSRYQLH